MPRIAIALAAFWFLSLFVFRSFLHWRRTGSTGVKGFHGRIGSLPWFAGTFASVGLALAGLAPFGALLEWPAGALLVENTVVHWLGAVLAGVGIVGALMAQLSMGDSWRVGVDAKERTELVTTGLFRWVRNPIFTFISLSVIGLLLLVPNVLALVACVLTLLCIELQVRVVEEPYLRKTHGEGYERYTSGVGRFVPGVGKTKGSSRTTTERLEGSTG